MRSRGTQIVCVLLFCCYQVGAWAADSHISVTIEVKASDDQLKSRLISFFGREVRALHDVQVVDSQPDFVISVLALQTETVRNVVTGFAVSTLVYEPFDNSLVVQTATEKERPTVRLLTSNLMSTSFQSFLNTAGPNDLPSTVQDIVAQIDAKVFEGRRKLIRMVNDWKSKGKVNKQ